VIYRVIKNTGGVKMVNAGVCKDKITKEEFYFLRHKDGGSYKIFVNDDDTGESDYWIEEKDFNKKFEIIEIED
jgi:hypothetical protein